MKLVACFILRQKTRPSEEESARLLGYHLILHHGNEFASALAVGVPEHLKFFISNPIPEADINDCFDQFVRSCGGGRYFDDSAAFHVTTYDFESGDSPEPTKMAIVFARLAEETPGGHALPSEFAPFVQRGERFEALARWGDAAQCYCIAIKLHGEHPDLHFRVGRALLHHPHEMAVALEFLKKAADSLPNRGDVRAALGRCYATIAANEAITAQGPSRDELRAMALAQLEVAAQLEPDDSDIAEELAALRGTGGGDKKDSFFD